MFIHIKMLSYWLWRISWLNDIMFILFTNCEKKYYSLSSKISDFLTCLSQWDRKTTITCLFICQQRSPEDLVWLISVCTCCLTVTWRISLVEKDLLIILEYLTSPSVFSAIPVGQCLVFCVMFCRQLFVLLSFFFGNYHTMFQSQ